MCSVLVPFLICFFSGDSSEITVTNNFVSKKDRSAYSLKRYDGPLILHACNGLFVENILWKESHNAFVCLRWLHKPIVNFVVHTSVMFWLLFITCNKRGLIILSSLLKFWVVVLNYKCPNNCGFYCFYGVICDFLEFPSEISFKIFTVHRIQWDKNFKHEKSRDCKDSFFSLVPKFVLYRYEKTGTIDFIEKRAPSKAKYLIYYQSAQSYGISPKEMRENLLSV